MRSAIQTASVAKSGRIAIALALMALSIAIPGAGARAQMAPNPPVFLVATPDLGDPIFQQVVVLLLPARNSPLVIGVIINQPTTIPVKTLLPDAPADLANTVAYFGGPVEINSPVVITRAAVAPPGSTGVMGELYWMDDPAAVAAFIKGNPAAKSVRIYYGRAQWLPAQLRGEILSGAWHVQPADPDLVFSGNPKSLWRTLVHRGQYEETRFDDPLTTLLRAPIEPIGW